MNDEHSDRVVRDLLERWADAIARHAPDDVAALFDPDALFQGFDPTPVFGTAAVAAYYDKQPLGLTASYELIHVRSLDADHLLGFASVRFVRPEGPVPVHLTVVAARTGTGWRITHYHVSRIAPAP